MVIKKDIPKKEKKKEVFEDTTGMDFETITPFSW